jgi:isopentenyl-diphosphate Delta-isomerase
MEQVILLDETGAAIDVADKATVHHHATPLHLAFSAYVFNPAGQLLMTRRAATKQTWPNVWTNSCCGHPQPGETLTDAVSRRLRDELHLTTPTIDLVLPHFRYRATMANGIVENEICPVFRVHADTEPAPNPAEVAEILWVPWPTLVHDVLTGGFVVSPWCHQQITQLNQLGIHPHLWTVAPTDELPPAAR